MSSKIPGRREYPPVGERPIDRLWSWGDGRWCMIFGEPDRNMLGRPTRYLGPASSDMPKVRAEGQTSP